MIMEYAGKLIRGYLLSYSGLLAVSLIFSYLANNYSSTPFITESPTLFHGLIVAPSEEMFFRYFVPLLLMYFGFPYLLGSCMVAAPLFAAAHYWAYNNNIYAMLSAFTAGCWNSMIVYKYSGREPFNFSPGLLCAMLGHASYNLTVTYMADRMLEISVITALLWALFEIYFRRVEE